MKKLGLILLVLTLCLTGCGQLPPAQAADGSPWSESWVTVGNVVGVDTPDNMEPRENVDALAASGMYYATWSIGEGKPYVNEDGDDAQVYDAQVYLLLAGFSSGEKAEEKAAQWLAMANDRYSVNGTQSVTCNGQEFTVVTYAFASETNPYAVGASAFGVYRNYAVSVELSCGEAFSGDPLETLTDFLSRCHYST